MVSRRIYIGNIPAIVWGQASEKVYIHVHGKMSCKEYAETFAMIGESGGYQTISFDLPEHGERKTENYRCDIWNGIKDLTLIADYAFANWQKVSLFACSIGAFFSLNAYKNREFEKCLFQSPILDMEYLIQQMFSWFGVTEERLREEKEIATPVDTLSWDYYQYVKGHPVVKWDVPTAILYGGKDNMQSAEVIERFKRTFECRVTVARESEHPFMAAEDVKIVHEWIERELD